MPKFTKKQVTIEAFEYYPTSVGFPQWFCDAIDAGDVHFEIDEPGDPDRVAIIKTLEGNHQANIGDYIIQGVKGELYPCKPDIFKMTYNPAKEDDGSQRFDPVLENNFRYHSPKPGQPEIYQDLREQVKELAYSIKDVCPQSREQSLALTKLEEAIFWANACIALN